MANNDIRWTPAQRTAIDASGCDLLVSASAGSGKTAVLVRRIIEHLTDPYDPTDIMSVLVVTFTNEAASQLKDKLGAAIKERIAQEPKNKFLRRQSADLQRASISTINSFCLDVVRTHFSQLGLASSVRIADESENRLIMQDVMDHTIEEFYTDSKKYQIEDFASFCDNFAQLRDEGLVDIFISIYNKLYSQLDGFDTLLNITSCADADIFDNIWGRQIKELTASYLSSVKKGYDTALSVIESDEGLYKAYYNAYSYDYDNIEKLLSALSQGYGHVYSLLKEIDFPRLGSARGETKYLAETVKPVRALYKKIIDKLCSMYCNDIRSANILTEKTIQLNRDLSLFLKQYHIRLMQEKNRRGIISFADCEALALELLYDNGKPTRTALEYRSRFKEVYIDEYQDVNSVQDAIFRMISPPNSRFMVGDIKQSIYGFRGAQPALFSEYRQEFSDYTPPKDDEERFCKVFLSNNFRSSRQILSFANAVSRTCFTEGESSIEYVDGDDLVYSKGEAQTPPVTLALVKKSDELSSEAVYTADRIEELINNGASVGDIAVLVRALGHSVDLCDELKARGIPYSCEVKREFFENPEILLALCWLNSIDNPRRDVFVCGVLKSPVYNFTLDDLVRIRKSCPSDTLYNSVLQYTQSNDFEKGRAFIGDIEALREAAKGMAAHELLWKLIFEKGLMSIVSANKSESMAAVARNNLLLLYDHARCFDNGEFRGVYDFLAYVQKLIEAKAPMPDAASLTGGTDAVRIMTIHKSKGLEFPYCFLYGSAHYTSSQDMRQKLVFHPELGIAAKIADNGGLSLYDTYIMRALLSRITDDNIEEEYRVLYVALTRAVNKLWITATVKNPDDTITEAQAGSCLVSKAYMTCNHSYLDWMLAALPMAEKGVVEVECVDTVQRNTESVESAESNECRDVDTDIDRDMLMANIGFNYPYSHASAIPSKMSVSRLYPDILDTLEADLLSTVITPKVPYFADGADDARYVNIGNATHAFMQFADFDNIERCGVRAELERLVTDKFISTAASELVDVCALERFFESELYSQIRSSDRVYREKRFNVSIPALELTGSMKQELADEKVLVQGVVDCFFYLNDNEICLVDYKTDRVKSSDILVSRYSDQLYYYKRAIESITGHRVVRSVIYSFCLGKCVEL